MKKRNMLGIKLFLDLVMLIVFILLIRKNNFGLVFHEIAGLVIFGMFLIHIVLNWRWVVNVSKKIFSSKLPKNLKFSGFLNLALLICFILIGISGIFISKIVFNISVGGNWKVVHYFCTALVIVLLGIHLGVHGIMIIDVLKKSSRLSSKIFDSIFAFITVVMIVLGCYSIETTSFKRWLSMPFNIQYNHNEKNSNFALQNGGNVNNEEFEKHNFEEHRDRDEFSKVNNGSNAGQMHGGRKPMKSDFKTILWNSLKYFSIIYLVAFISGIIDWIIKLKKFKIVGRYNKKLESCKK